MTMIYLAYGADVDTIRMADRHPTARLIGGTELKNFRLVFKGCKGDGTAFTHYIAVNGRTGRTMGSVPVSHPVIAAVAGVAGFAAFVVSLPMVGLLFF